MIFSNSVHFGFNKHFAKKYSIQYAMVLNRIIWSINYHAENADQWRDKFFIDEHWWMVDSCEAIANHFQGLISAVTVRRAIKAFEDDGLLISRKRKSMIWDQTKWYAIDRAIFDSIKNSPMIPHLITEKPSISQSTHLISQIKSTFDLPDQIGSIHEIKSSSLNNQTISHPINHDAPPALYSLSSLDLDKKPKSSKYDEQDLAIGQAWLDFALGEMKWKTASAAWTAERFAIDLAKIRKLTGVTHEGLRDLLAFIQKDKFWQDKAFSPAGLLRKNAEGIMKIDNILIQATKNERKNDKFVAMMNSEEPF